MSDFVRSMLSSNAAYTPGFTVTFHSGAMDTPENSLEFIRRALAERAEIIEVDVSYLPDGTAVLIHDSYPTDVGLPTLRSALELIAEQPGVQVNLDMKSLAGISAMDGLVADCGMTGRVFYTGIGMEWIGELRSASVIPYYLNENILPESERTVDYASELAERVRSVGAVGLNSNFRNADRGLVAALQAEGLLVSLWTPSTAEALLFVLAAEPDNITSRRPDLLRELLG